MAESVTENGVVDGSQTDSCDATSSGTDYSAQHLRADDSVLADQSITPANVEAVSTGSSVVSQEGTSASPAHSTASNHRTSVTVISSS